MNVCRNKKYEQLYHIDEPLPDGLANIFSGQVSFLTSLDLNYNHSLYLEAT